LGDFIENGGLLFLNVMAPRLPMLLLFAIGIVIAALRWNRHPGVSLLACLAFGLMGLSSVVHALAYTWVTIHWRQEGWTEMQMAYAYAILTGFQTTVSFFALILLMCAVFGWRNKMSSSIGAGG